MEYNKQDATLLKYDKAPKQATTIFSNIGWDLQT